MKRKKSTPGGANWMDTYGDMVTLLLCFFVLLYSISSVDQSKWIALVQSFNPNAIETMTESSGNGGPSADVEGDAAKAEQEMIDEAINKLYEELQNYVADNQETQNVEVTKGDGYVFVSFNDAVFFDGDSYVLREEGKQVLTTVASMLDSAGQYIDEVRVMGHTAQATADRPNDPTVDRFLSTNRAAVATVFLQENCTIDPARLVSVGYGQHRPVDSNDTPETRSHNRRVEIIITGFDVEDKLGDSIEQYYSERDGTYTAANGANSGGTAAADPETQQTQTEESASPASGSPAPTATTAADTAPAA